MFLPSFAPSFSCSILKRAALDSSVQWHHFENGILIHKTLITQTHWRTDTPGPLSVAQHTRGDRARLYGRHRHWDTRGTDGDAGRPGGAGTAPAERRRRHSGPAAPLWNSQSVATHFRFGHFDYRYRLMPTWFARFHIRTWTFGFMENWPECRQALVRLRNVTMNTNCIRDL